MKMSKLLGERLKETPNGVSTKSHAYLLRAGFIKQVSNGIYTLLPPAKRVVKKIENIVRQEMDALDGQEVLMPVVMPRELWEESGRYYSIGDEMVRFNDRTGHDMLLGMTHEEAAIHACKNIVKSYDQLPIMIYQIQTKFRDEARPRAGLIRVKEFTMKDAYSFHTSQSDLEDYYKKQYDAYTRIFKRIGMKKVIAVKSDSGMMGGNISHEFMLITDIGEDTIAVCDKCDYKANMEVATCELDTYESSVNELKEVFTGSAKEIDEVCNLLSVKAHQTCKAVCYAIKGTDKIVVAFVRGDLEVNESKLKLQIGADVAPCELEGSGLVKGNIGPIGLDGNDKLSIIFDNSLLTEKSLICGANKDEYHFSGFNLERDIKYDKIVADIAKVKDGAVCPVCGGKLNIVKGIEVGNIFQLGTKYTKSMNMTIHNEKGEEFNPIMGCYGIGIGRAMASVAEESSDDKGLVWPVNIAPWQVYLCPLRLDDENVANTSNKIYEELTTAGIEVLVDDRNCSAGVKFSDSELMGVPFRVVVSPRSLAGAEVELSYRASGEKEMIKVCDIVSKIKSLT